MVRLPDHLGTVSGPSDFEPPGATCFRHACANAQREKAWHAARHHVAQRYTHHRNTHSITSNPSRAMSPSRCIGRGSWDNWLSPSRVSRQDTTTAITCLLWQQTTRTSTISPTHTPHSPRAGSREDFLLLDTRRMELYYHHYEHSSLIPGHRTRAYDWFLLNIGLGFMMLLF